MAGEPYEMTDEELELFNKKYMDIVRIIDGMPGHLVAPLLLRLTVGAHLDLKGFGRSEATLTLARNLVSELTNTLILKTVRHITESN